jgi:hypothetical protein
MLNPDKLKATIENTTIHPNKDAVKCEMLADDNSTYTTNVIKEEAELTLYLKLNIFPKLSPKERSKLIILIDDYGQVMYEDGQDSEQ